MASSSESQTAAPAARKIKYTILAALAAVVAVAVFVSVFFIVLSPARVSFTVTHSSCGNDSSDGMIIYLVLAANNTSERAAVKYQSMFVNVANSTGPQWLDKSSEISANVLTAMPLRQPTQNVTTMEATVSLVAGAWGIGDDASNHTTNKRFLVIITVQARFKVGIARTRLYDIKVTCGPLKFPNCKETTLPLQCVY
ncbi:hypothetical protein BS78_10G015100 [Paspalum vaginatum]|nr:hypothetical protein BS78_10G015100 [Paspalum vaginatum]